MKRLVGYFLNGIIFTAPAGLTIYVVWWIFTTVDGWLRIPMPGVGFLITLGLITMIGFLATNFLARRLLQWMDDFLELLPGVRLLYTAIKDVTDAFVGEKRRFSHPVIVTINPAAGAEAIGFLTQDSLAELGMADHVTVYLPFSYSIMGQMLVFPRDRVRPLPANGAKVMTFVVSGGVSEIGAGRE